MIPGHLRPGSEDREAEGGPSIMPKAQSGMASCPRLLFEERTSTRCVPNEVRLSGGPSPASHTTPA
jgi:hypothetical protein